MTLPTVYQLRRNPNANSPMLYGEGPPPRAAKQADGQERPPQPYPELTIHDLPLTKPPYGRITAFDMNQGTKVWMTPNGDGPRDHPLLKDLNLPPLGNAGRPVALLTRTLLFVADSSNAVMGRAGVGGPAKLRAYDKTNGKLIAQVDLPVGATGGPMTYMADGKQYIVVPVGGKGYGGGWVALGLGSPGIYSEAQAQRGQNIYRARCAGCHASDLSGEHAPPLKGDPFWAEWQQAPVRSLYSRIISNMPPDDPGSLPEKDVVDLVGYLLQVNGLPAGSRAIESASDLNSVRLQRPK
jgi:mono/diheme cytochrome c family protein